MAGTIENIVIIIVVIFCFGMLWYVLIFELDKSDKPLLSMTSEPKYNIEWLDSRGVGVRIVNGTPIEGIVTKQQGDTLTLFNGEEYKVKNSTNNLVGTKITIQPQTEHVVQCLEVVLWLSNGTMFYDSDYFDYQPDGIGINQTQIQDIIWKANRIKHGGEDDCRSSTSYVFVSSTKTDLDKIVEGLD